MATAKAQLIGLVEIQWVIVATVEAMLTGLIKQITMATSKTELSGLGEMMQVNMATVIAKLIGLTKYGRNHMDQISLHFLDNQITVKAKLNGLYKI